MQKIYFSLVSLLLFSIAGHAQNWGNQNYVVSTTARVKVQTQAELEGLTSKEDKVVTIQYFDGLGRLIQEVDWKSSPSGKDVIVPHEYDGLGREAKKYLPFTTTFNNDFLTNATAEQFSFYNSATPVDHAQDMAPFSLAQFEASPLNRVIEQGHPGMVWQPDPSHEGRKDNGEHTSIMYHNNDYGEGANAFIREQLNATVSALPEDATLGSPTVEYAPGMLYLNGAQNENGSFTFTFSDRLGRTIKSVALIEAGSQPENHKLATTVNVYDHFGRLKYLIQPEGWELVETDNALTQIVLDDYTFHYEYDDRGRVIGKKVPGADWVYTVYNDRDLPIYTQEGAQREKNEWSFIKYDNLNRPIITGVVSRNVSRTNLQAEVDVFAGPFFEEKADNTARDMTNEEVEGYTNLSLPLLSNNGDATVYSVSYYDDYDFDQSGNITGHETGKPNNASDRTRGMVTGIKVRVLNPDDDMPVWMWTTTFYDDWGRELKTLSDNQFHRNGTTSYGRHNRRDQVTHGYNFVGEKTKTTHRHIRPDGDDYLTTTNYLLDHRGRIIRENEQFRDDNTVIGKDQIAYYEYNELGQMVAEKLGPENNSGDNPLQEVNYDYNIRGWLTHINKDDDDCVSKADLIPPSPITDLVVSTGASNGNPSGRVQWTFTAPGDDGMTGGNVNTIQVCFGFDPSFKDSSRKGVDVLEYRTNVVFHQTTAGQQYSFSWPGFQYGPYPNTLTYFALRTIDDAGNISPFSNVVTFTPLQDVISTPFEDAEPYNYTIDPCQSCEDRPGTALEIKVNSWQVTFDLATNGAGDQLLEYTVADQRDLMTYKPSANGIVAVDVSDNFTGSVVIDPNYQSQTMPEIFALQSYTAGILPPYSFTYKDNPGFDGSELFNSVRKTVEDAIAYLGFDATISQEVVEDITTIYFRHIRDDMAAGGNMDLFSMKLSYNEGFEEINANAVGQYNGNISGMAWRGPTNCTWKGYGYQYDPLNRVTNAHYGINTGFNNPWSATDAYTTSYMYDRNGNITMLNRRGLVDFPNGGPLGILGDVDLLTYDYTGNRLNEVVDGATGVLPSLDFFTDGASPGIEYTYDGSGNMTSDGNRDITVTYNFLNKPTLVKKGTDRQIEYTYTSDGTKLRQKVVDLTTSTVEKVTEYVNKWQYEDADGAGTISGLEITHIIHSKGRYVPNGSSWTKEFFVKDHLGNTRIVFGDYDGDGRINPDPNGNDLRQLVEGYYPFGATHNEVGTALVNVPENQYLYNGKEKQDELDLGWYDYGARMYDVSIARWNGVDALAEEYISWSPYNYTLNNPLRFIDPDGNMVTDPPKKVDVRGQIVDAGAEAKGLQVGDVAKTKNKLTSTSSKVINDVVGVEPVVFKEDLEAISQFAYTTHQLSNDESKQTVVGLPVSGFQAGFKNDELQLSYEGSVFLSEATLEMVSVIDLESSNHESRNITISAAQELGINFGSTSGPENSRDNIGGEAKITDSTTSSKTTTNVVNKRFQIKGYIYSADVQHNFKVSYISKGFIQHSLKKTETVTTSTRTQFQVTSPLTPNKNSNQ
ncbi:MAG: RHS repeat-associated core domain-containing protein [Bacteroidia bacterium]|nr:RHS repeat-associated core domain-containing protein [Bacteroidia bacterium]